MHLSIKDLSGMPIAQLEGLHYANSLRPSQVPLSALRTATELFQAKDGVIQKGHRPRPVHELLKGT